MLPLVTVTKQPVQKSKHGFPDFQNTLAALSNAYDEQRPPDKPKPKSNVDSFLIPMDDLPDDLLQKYGQGLVDDINSVQQKNT